jgi:Asp-tRNA(Asn)/Glu-tRNA(Gln) amidotransferase A subunit family amidase
VTGWNEPAQTGQSASVVFVECRHPKTCSYQPTDADRAQQIDRVFAEGKDPGQLVGILLAMKDIFCVRSTPSIAGSRMREHFVAPFNATPMERSSLHCSPTRSKEMFPFLK